MNRFFFHFSCKDAFIPDTHGRECADLLAARHYAMQVVYKIVSLDGADWRG